MNDPKDQPIEIEDQKRWLRDYRADTGFSWAELAKRMGIAQGTLSQFGSEKGYGGDNQRVAEEVFRYRQLLVTQSQISLEAPEIPGYFDTETSKRLISMLHWAQRGRIVVAALGPGSGKTMTARHFAACYPNVAMATMTPSTAGVNNMQIEVLEALGERDAVGTPQKLSKLIRQRVNGLANPLIILDEVQHLSVKALEEIRSWNDATGVGIALFGNLGVMQQLEGGTRKAAFAQLFSRVALKLVRAGSLTGDADALAEAWRVTDETTIGLIRKITALPGGLRSATMAMELASMLAAGEKDTLRYQHLQDAWSQLSTRTVAG